MCWWKCLDELKYYEILKWLRCQSLRVDIPEQNASKIPAETSSISAAEAAAQNSENRCSDSIRSRQQEGIGDLKVREWLKNAEFIYVEKAI